MLYQIEFNSTISENVTKVFRELHVRKVYHEDVRIENILVKSNNSIVVIDFERNIMNVDEKLLKDEMKKIKSLLINLIRNDQRISRNDFEHIVEIET